jgi:DNA-binding transcriptional LysR family regulator
MDDTNFVGMSVGGRRLTLVFSQLQHAFAAADFGSFRQAAHALSIKQSTLSRSVQLLEHSIGVVIFERSSGGVRATPAGRHFLRMTRSILEQIEALIASTRAHGSGEAGRLVMGFCTSLTAGNLRATLLDFKKLFPQVELVTVERSRTRLATALRNGVVDVSIVTGDPQHLDSKTTPLPHSRYGVWKLTTKTVVWTNNGFQAHLIQAASHESRRS